VTQCPQGFGRYSRTTTSPLQPLLRRYACPPCDTPPGTWMHDCNPIPNRLPCASTTAPSPQKNANRLSYQGSSPGFVLACTSHRTRGFPSGGGRGHFALREGHLACKRLVPIRQLVTSPDHTHPIDRQVIRSTDHRLGQAETRRRMRRK